MSKPLFTAALEAIDPSTVLRTEARPNLLRRRYPLAADALGATRTPSNQEILDAARQHYKRQSSVVDMNTLAGQHYVRTSPGHQQVSALNAYDWKSRQAGPITPTALAVAAAPIVQPGLQAAYQSDLITSCVVGISESAQVLVGEEGGIGIAQDLQGNTKGVAYVAGKLGLDIDLALNLQIGLWASDLPGLAGEFVGLEVNLDLEIGVSLGIYLKPKDLSFYGFSIGLGVGVGGGATVVGGYTWVF